MITYIIISIILGIIILYCLWKYSPSKWISLPIICLMATSVYFGRWHYYYRPLAYQHLLTKSINNESKFRNAVNTYKHDDTGWTRDFHPFAHQKLKDKRNDTKSNLQKLKSIKAPKNMSNRAARIKAQEATIRALQYQLRRYKNIQ